MADEFVDLYEILGVPLDADREVLRKRINEMYLEAQRNLDHRSFQMRVKYQEIFEVTMPQARYILLDAGRRAEYDRMVSSMRGLPPQSSAPPPVKSKKNDPNVPSRSNPALGTGSTAGFRLAPPETEVAGKAPKIDPLPVSGFDSERMAKERDELWRKWKSGLEEALAREKEAENAPRPVKAPTSPASSSSSSSTSQAKPNSPPVQFDFSQTQNSEEEREQERALQQQQEQRRTEHRRKMMKDMLEGAALKGTLIGVFAVAVPGVIAMVAFMSHYYPRNAKPLLQLSQNLAWLIWGAVIVVGAFVMARVLSKSMRRNMASELNSLSYEDLVRRANRG